MYINNLYIIRVKLKTFKCTRDINIDKTITLKFQMLTAVGAASNNFDCNPSNIT